MSTFFENINKNSVQLDVLHGWDVNAKAWYIDIKMTGFSGNGSCDEIEQHHLRGRR